MRRARRVLVTSELIIVDTDSNGVCEVDREHIANPRSCERLFTPGCEIFLHYQFVSLRRVRPALDRNPCHAHSATVTVQRGIRLNRKAHATLIFADRAVGRTSLNLGRGLLE